MQFKKEGSSSRRVFVGQFSSLLIVTGVSGGVVLRPQEARASIVGLLALGAFAITATIAKLSVEGVFSRAAGRMLSKEERKARRKLRREDMVWIRDARNMLVGSRRAERKNIRMLRRSLRVARRDASEHLGADFNLAMSQIGVVHPRFVRSVDPEEAVSIALHCAHHHDLLQPDECGYFRNSEGHKYEALRVPASRNTRKEAGEALQSIYRDAVSHFGTEAVRGFDSVGSEAEQGLNRMVAFNRIA